MVSTALPATKMTGFAASLTDMRIGWEPRVAEFPPRLGRGKKSRSTSFEH